MLGLAAPFTVALARAELARLRPLLEEFVTLRADAAELATALAGGASASVPGGVPELKGAQARLDELVERLLASGVQVKGFAPLLLDFPAELDGVQVLLCWLEGDHDLLWYHRADLGFAGRRLLG
jgi:arsenite methyltransferase